MGFKDGKGGPGPVGGQQDDKINVMISCNFCSNKIKEEDLLKASSWAWGERGKTGYYGFSGLIRDERKHACPTELCRAKLLVWARS